MTEEKKPNIFKRLNDKNNKLWAKFHSPTTRIANKAKWYSIVPLVVILIGALMITLGAFGVNNVGFNLGLDFTGGSVVEATGFVDDEQRDTAQSEVKTYLNDHDVTYDISTPWSATNGYGLSIKYQGDNQEISEGLIGIIENYTSEVKPTETISASASGERIMITFISIAVTLIAILIYILFRFKFTAGVSALIGLFHDVLVVVALTAIFRIQVNYPYVAALITLVVYSLNNTIVLFDRVRGKEKLLKASGRREPVENVVDASIKETFGRTLATTITTLVPVIVLCCLPVPLIRAFALPIMFGLIAGSFSTIFVTTGLYVRFEKFKKLREHEKTHLSKPENLVTAD